MIHFSSAYTCCLLNVTNVLFSLLYTKLFYFIFRLTEVGMLETPLLQGKYGTGQVFMWLCYH